MDPIVSQRRRLVGKIRASGNASLEIRQMDDTRNG
jgi:hypothetical protein